MVLREQPRQRDLPRVAPLRSAMLVRRSTTAWLFCNASGANRGIVARMSFPASKLVVAVTVPVRNPLPTGLYGTKPMPSS
jgi:hypothetical protein